MNRADKVAIGVVGLCALGGVMLLDLAFSLIFAVLHVVLVTAGVLAFAGLAVGVQSGARKRLVFLEQRAAAERATRELEKSRFSALTHLTEADERWLAERHFWAPPVEVPRLRAGRPHDQTWDWYEETRHSFSGSRMPAEIVRRRDMQRLADKSRAQFEGVNLTASEPAPFLPVEGDIVPGKTSGTLDEALYRAAVKRDAAQARRNMDRYGYR